MTIVDEGTPEPLASTDPLLISGIEHHSYCPRQFALIHVEQLFADNVHTLRGQAVHQRVDTKRSEYQKTRGTRLETALPLFSERLGLTGRADMVEFLPDGTPYPIEYKHGPNRQRAHDELQLAAQALCLEEMFNRPVPEGAIYHATSRARRVVPIGPDLRQRLVETLAAMRALVAARRVPPPVADRRCRECSLIDLCQPHAFDSPAISRLRAQRARLFEPD